MNVLMVTEIYLPIWGGAENQLRQLIPHLETLGCEISIVTRRWHPEMERDGEVDGVSVYRLGIPGEGLLATLFFMVDLILYLVRNRSEIDILHSHGAVKMGALCTLVARLIQVKNIVKIASAGRVCQFNKHIIGKCVLAIFKRADVIISMTEEIDTELITIATDPMKIVRITNGVDTTRFFPADSGKKVAWRKNNQLSEDAVLCLFSSRIVYGKGLDLLIEAWSNVAARFPDVHLLIVGSGDDQPDSVADEMILMVKDNAIPRVIFYGATSEPERLLQVADVFVFPSRREGFPNALMEAMATALPVLASDIGGVTPLVTNNHTGMLFQTENAESLRKALEYMLENLENLRELGCTARKEMIDNYTFQRISQSYYSSYKSLIS